MKVLSDFIKRFHLDSTFCLLSARNTQLIYEYFKLLDTRNQNSLDDVQFLAFMQTSTDLKVSEIYKIFDVFDLDRSGSCEFDEFYLLVCILVAIKDGQAKTFLYRHWRTCFELLDENSSKSVSKKEFETLGFLFNFSNKAVKKIFSEFDVSGNSELDYKEFRLFAFAAIDLEAELEKKQKRQEKARRQSIISKSDRRSINSGMSHGSFK
ncbi:EF-hand [Rozella allomycis CSF55]|uniref:EF-hand n=1 Tax=Rozella allomycis (strain CSF55) TaxID=988480 RepID=A0A075B222_ROZAC|nr:EF-Hand 1, calcium-binding site domain-containing protein [Rozella allomycis CSF55]RKP18325.1 EF-hand [Rozella allomycis CSF55]|eukprot:EPZ34868.1 EF-Hand 1, calcium-binding site domain-containing protein [Rozella allomycis CSF55]